MSANDHQASAVDFSASSTPRAIGYRSSTISNLGFSDQGIDPISNQAVLDNNTLAAMIAAENAALTAPQYFIDLPLIIR